jgi:predicted metal-dependent hydrolase
VRVAAPPTVSDAAVRAAVAGKLAWIRRPQAAFAQQARESDREMASGESHYFFGRRYRLELVEAEGPGRVVLKNRAVLQLHARLDLSAEQRERVLRRWSASACASWCRRSSRSGKPGSAWK